MARHHRDDIQLPESPQHRHWREARQTAAEHMDKFRGELHKNITEATSLLDAESPTPSAAWYTLGEQFLSACRQLGSATYCLNEWTEPDDATADIDQPPYNQSGRRNPRPATYPQP